MHGIDESVIEKMRERYRDVHPLIFARSVERATSPGELFDILEALPPELPLMWDDSKRRWVTTADLTQSSKFELEVE